ncbi:MAG: hypothetical protein ABSF44_07245 [Candidatus Bathyarchaeia archaeon]|jgi:hypothetical protein
MNELNNPDRPKTFDQVVLEAMDEALLIIGENATASIYAHLEDLFKIKKEEIPRKLSDFSNALGQIFGLGARHLEILFLKKLYAKFEVTFNWPTYEGPLSKWIVPEMTFPEYVRLMRESFEAEKDDKVEIGVLVNEQYEELQK